MASDRRRRRAPWSEPAYSAPSGDPSARIPRCPTLPTPTGARPRARPRLRHDGDERVDPWFWLRERDDPEVLAYLEAENAYTDAVARAHRRRSATASYAEIVGARPGDRRVGARSAAATSSTSRAPSKASSTTCTAGGRRARRARRTRTRRPGSATGETVVLDENVLAHGHDYFAVGDLAINPAQTRRRVHRPTPPAASATTCGSATLDTGDDLADVVADVYYGLAWANDDRTVLYARPDDAMRPWQVWRHTLGTPAPTTTCSSSRRTTTGSSCRCRAPAPAAYLVITSASKITTEVWLVDADDPTAGAARRRAARAGSRVPRRAPRRSRPATASSCSPTPTAPRTSRSWSRRPTRPARDALDDRARRTGPTSVSTTSTRSPAISSSRSAPTGSSASGCCTSTTTAPSATTTSIATDGAGVLDVDRREPRVRHRRRCATATRRSSRRRRRTTTTSHAASRHAREAPAGRGLRPARYATERLWATAPDGTRVPISLVYRRDLRARRTATRCCSTATARTRCRSTRRSRRRG